MQTPQYYAKYLLSICNKKYRKNTFLPNKYRQQEVKNVSSSNFFGPFVFKSENIPAKINILMADEQKENMYSVAKIDIY